MAKIQQVTPETMQSIRELDALGYSVNIETDNAGTHLEVVPMTYSRAAERFTVKAPTDAEAFASAIARIKETI